MEKKTIKGVIFDMDGLLLDTERLYVDAWLETGRLINRPLSEQLVHDCVGLDIERTRQKAREALGEDFDYDRARSVMVKLLLDRMEREGIPLKEGVFELLRFLRERQIPVAVATSTHRELALSQLSDTGILMHLDAAVCGDMVENGKPAPDIFLAAAAALGLEPGDCAVFEDSPHGILGAYRAGCMPVMVPDLVEPDAETEKLLYAKLGSLKEATGLF